MLNIRNNKYKREEQINQVLLDNVFYRVNKYLQQVGNLNVNPVIVGKNLSLDRLIYDENQLFGEFNLSKSLRISNGEKDLKLSLIEIPFLQAEKLFEKDPLYGFLGLVDEESFVGDLNSSVLDLRDSGAYSHFRKVMNSHTGLKKCHNQEYDVIARKLISKDIMPKLRSY